MQQNKKFINKASDSTLQLISYKNYHLSSFSIKECAKLCEKAILHLPFQLHLCVPDFIHVVQSLHKIATF